MFKNSLCFLRCLLFISFLLLAGGAARGQAKSDAAAKAAIVAPFLDDQTLLVARIDLRQIDPAELVKSLGRLAPPSDADFPKQLAKLEQKVKESLNVLTTSGVSELFAVVSLADLPKEPMF